MTFPAAPPQPPYPQPPPPRAGGKGKTWILVAAVVAVVGGVAITLALTLGGKGGKASADDAIRAVVASATAGDDKALLALSGADGVLAKLMSCTDKSDADDQAKDLARVPLRMKDAVDKWKGYEATVVSITADGAPDKIEQGAKASGSCTFTASASAQRYDVVLRFKKGGGGLKQGHKRVEVVEIDGRWYVPDPPDAFDDDDGEVVDVAADGTVDDDLGTLRKMRDAACACKDPACAKKVQDELEAFGKKTEAKYKDKAPGEKLVKVVTEMAECIAKASTPEDPPPPPPPEPPPPAPTGGDVAGTPRGSADAVAAAAAQAAAQGDADAMFELTGGTQLFAQLFDCPGGDVSSLVGGMRATTDRVALGWKGTDVSVASMVPAKRNTVAAGTDLDACKTKVELELDVCDLTLAYTKDGVAKTFATKITVLEHDGQWYLLDFPAAP